MAGPGPAGTMRRWFQSLRMSPHSTLSSPRILLVDDSADATDLMSMALEQEGYSIAAVAGGAEALDYLARHPAPVCMFIDYDMPGMNGLQLAQAVRQRHGDDIVLIAITGSFDGERQRVQAFLDFVDHHFWKPVDWKRLLAVIASLRD